MIKVILRLSCGIGMDSANSYLVSEEDWAEYINPTVVYGTLSEFTWVAAVDHASMYGIYPESDRPDKDKDEDEDEDEDDYGDKYSDGIEGWFELYDPDKHDGLMVGSQKEWVWTEI